MQKTEAEKITDVFQTRLEDLIAGSGKKISDLAAKIGIAAGSLSAYQNGTAEAGITKLKKIADYFNVSSDYLLGGHENKTMDNEAIRVATGLSNEAIELLRQLKEYNFALDEKGNKNDLVSMIITHRSCQTLFAQMLLLKIECDEITKNYDKYVKATDDDLAKISAACKEYGLIASHPASAIKDQKDFIIDIFSEILFDVCGEKNIHNEFKKTFLENLSNKAINKVQSKKKIK